MAKEFKDAKIKYERIIKESMQNAKETVMNSLPTNYKGRNTDYWYFLLFLYGFDKIK